jgi:hypothetical protein
MQMLNDHPISLVYIVLGHEIVFPSHDLSRSSALRCDLLYSLIHNIDSRAFLVLFMGKGRLQGDCEKTISECMNDYYARFYGAIKNLYIDRMSKDTVGDAVYSKEVVSQIACYPDIAIITSDWHAFRAEHIFRKVFDQFPKSLSVHSTDEITYLSEKDFNMINSSEKLSLQAFNSTFSEIPANCSWMDLLMSRHPLYRVK